MAISMPARVSQSPLAEMENTRKIIRSMHQSDATSIFEWNFGDGRTAVGQNVEHQYDKPGGYVVQLTITDTEGCTNDNFITQRVRISPPPEVDFSGQLDSALCLGDTVALKMDNISSRIGEFLPGATTPSDTTILNDGVGTSNIDTITIATFSPGQRLQSINDLRAICVNIEHTFMRDLEIKITCPSGKVRLLWSMFPILTK